jgi:hypothetical protein
VNDKDLNALFAQLSEQYKAEFDVAHGVDQLRASRHGFDEEASHHDVRQHGRSRRPFIAWLDFYILGEDPASVLKGLVGLMAFAGLLGTILGNQVIRVGAFVVVIVFVVSVILMLLADRRRSTQQLGTHHKLLTRYCDFVRENSLDPLVSVESWDQTVYLRPNGDVHEVLVIKAIALRERVYFVVMTAGSRWEQPDQYRRNVEVAARGLTVNGLSGTRWNVTTSWTSSQKMTAVLHLHEPVKAGEEINFEVVRTWPGKCRPLMRERTAEDFVLRTTSLLVTNHVTYKIVLPKGFEAIQESIGQHHSGVNLVVLPQRDHEGRTVFAWSADHVPTEASVGIRLQLSKPAP